MKKIIAKINKNKCWFFEEINEIDKPSARFLKRKMEKMEISKTEMKKVITDPVEIQKIITDYYEQP